MTDLIAELAEVVRLSEAVSFADLEWGWRNDDDAPGSIFTHSFGGLHQAVAMCPRYGKENFAADASCIIAAVNFLRTNHAELTRILTDYPELRAAHHDLVIRLGEVTTELEAARKDAERYRWMRENEWDEPVVKLYDGDFDNASGETLDSAIDAAMKESGK